MKKKTLLIAGLVLFTATLAGAALTGCDNTTAGSYEFEEYTFNYGGVSEKDWRALEYPDKDIEMDGIVKEEEYGKGNLSFSDVNDVNMKVYAHMGEEGVFFGFVSDDKLVNYNTHNDVFNNTSVEIQVAPSGTETLNANVVQLRLGANGTPDQWVGFPADDGAYSYTKKYIPSMGVVHIDGTLNESAEGYSVELYLPYSSIGLSEKPESVVCAPSFNTMPDPLSSARATWTMMLGCNLSEPATWYVVDGSGMTAHTAGFGEKNGVIAQNKGFNEFYYFDTVPHESYYLKTKLTVQTTTSPFLNGDMYPKFGLVNKSEHALQTFHIDAAQRTGTNFGTVRAVQTTAGGTGWLWDNEASTSMAGHWGNEYISSYRNKTLETIYYGGDLYFVLDGVLVKSVKDFSPAEEGAIPGFMCFNTKATFEDSEFETDAAKVKAEAEKYLAKDVKIDGDLSDWKDEDVNRHFKSASDPNGNSMKVRAFRGTDGLYLAYEVEHNVNLAPSKWDEGWWLNTNIEFFVNGNAENQHYALTSFGDSGYMEGVMNTVREEDRTYSTVGEIFVPFTTLEKDGFNREETLRVGLAFKTANGTPDDKLNGRDWWSFEGEPNAVLFPVQTKGIGQAYTLTYSKGSESDVTGDAPAVQEVFGGDTVKLAANPFARAGYKFVCWTDGAHDYAAGADFTMPAEDVTLTPRWVSSSATGSYHVTYAKGEGDVQGTLPNDDVTYSAGDPVLVKACELTYEGYRFMGWNDGNTVHQPGTQFYIEDGDVVLTAVWSKLYTLTYSLDEDAEGEVPAAAQYVEGENVSITTNAFTRSGYTFYGWKYNDDVYFAGGTFEMPAENVTLTAQWKPLLTVDGSLDDWKGLDSKTLSAHALGSDQRGGVWYGVLRDDGLYLAAELFHNVEPINGRGNWFDNMNFEIRLGNNDGANHYYVYLTAKTGNFSYEYRLGRDAGDLTGAQAKYVCLDGTSSGVVYHGIFEVFLPASFFSTLKTADGALPIGIALKTGPYEDGAAEKITGGSVNYPSGDTWYAPYGVWPDNSNYFAYVTYDGLLYKNEYLHPDWKFGAESAIDDDEAISLDGNLSDWADVHTIGIVGSDQYTGKSVKFYGKMTKAGLYLAAEAYHDTFTTGQTDWWNNTNFELRIGNNFGGDGNKMPKQFYVFATSQTTFGTSDSYMQVSGKTEQLDTNKYHTVVEVFIPAADLIEYDYMVQNGAIQVGVAWKTNGDNINNSTIPGDPWWMPQGEHVNSNPAVVDGTGIYTAQEYASRD